MFHGLDNSFLYSAYRITTEFTSEINEPTAGHGTGFWVMTNQSQLALVTNRHIVDPEYADLKNRGYQLKRLIVSGKCNVPPSKLPDIDVIFEVVDPDVHYSEVYQNDIACIFNPRVKADIGSPTTIDFLSQSTCLPQPRIMNLNSASVTSLLSPAFQSGTTSSNNVRS